MFFILISQAWYHSFLKSHQKVFKTSLTRIAGIFIGLHWDAGSVNSLCPVGQLFHSLHHHTFVSSLILFGSRCSLYNFITYWWCCKTDNHFISNMTLLISIVEYIKPSTAFRLFRVSLLIITLYRGGISKPGCPTNSVLILIILELLY